MCGAGVSLREDPSATKKNTSPKRRQLTVCNKGFARVSGPYVFFPVIILTGKWLAEAGFRAGHVVNITCEDQRLIITIAQEQRFEGV